MVDNVKYYNDSLAYDFKMFMPRTAVRPEENDNIVKIPQAAAKTKARRQTAARKLSAPVYAVMICVFMLAALCGNIFLRLSINETNSKINDIKEEIAVLDSERTSLEVEFERYISYSNIELEAAKIGMQKMDKKQVKYIRVNDKNSATTTHGKVVSSENN